jgi:glyoxylate reductase
MRKALATLAEFVVSESVNRAEFLEECASGRLDGVRVIYRTFESVDLTGRFDQELVAHLPASVKFVCHTGTYNDFISLLWGGDSRRM